MSLLVIILVIAFAGLILWLVEKYIPMDPGLKTLLRVVVIAIVIWILLRELGVLHYLSTVKI